MKLKNKFQYIFGILLLIPVTGCGIYSFSGANISPDIKSVSIDYFFNEAGDGPPILGQQFTESLKDYFQNNTSLSMDNTGNGDIQLSGVISGFRYTPVAATSTGDKNQPDVAGLQRLTITVKVTYTDTKNDENSFDKSFSFYADYNPTTSTLTQVEPQLVEDIFKNIVLDIFNATVANW
jgi:hypothetical protein